MPSRTKSAIAPLYLLSCLILGGSAEGIWQNAVLELFGAAILAWAASRRSAEAMSREAKLLLLLLLATTMLVALAATPWPASWFAGGMAGWIADHRLVERAASDAALPLAPHLPVTSLFLLVPPLAIFCAMTRVRAYRSSWLVAALLAGTIAGILLPALQAASAANPASNGYRPTGSGPGTGFFASADDMASLLLVSLPFIAAIGVAARPHMRSYSALLLLLFALAAIFLAALVLTGSIAGYALSGPVLCASAPVLMRLRGWRRLVLLVAGLLWLAAWIAVVALYGDGNAALRANGYSGFSRDTGLLGILVILLFLLWWTRSMWDIWHRRRGGPFVEAASIASAALLILSLAHFALGTAAISSCFAMCLAFLVNRRLPRAQEREDLRPTRHVIVG